MYARLVFTICFLFVVLNATSQDKIKLPNTIYNQLSEVLDGDNLRHINVNLKPYRFRFLSQYDIINYKFVIDFANFGKKASVLDYDSYKNLEIYKYHDKPFDLYDWHAFQYREHKRLERIERNNANKTKSPVGKL